MIMEVGSEGTQKTGLPRKAFLETVFNSLKSAVEVQDGTGHLAPHFLEVLFRTHNSVAKAEDLRVQASNSDESKIQTPSQLMQSEPVYSK